MKIQAKKFIAESLLIVFSVLFALFISHLVENKKAKNQKKQALEYIYKELENNEAILERWIWKHGKIRDKLKAMIANPLDSTRKAMTESNNLDFGLITEGESLIDALLTETAWEAAKSTKIVSDFDFELVQEFTRIYGLQKILMEGSASKFFEIYLDRESHILENLPTTLIQLSLVMEEMVGQEMVTQEMIENTLARRDQ